MVAIFVFAIAHVTTDVSFALEPSLYVAVAVNCCVPPAWKLAVAGDMARLFSVFWLWEVPVPEPDESCDPHPVRNARVAANTATSDR